MNSFRMELKLGTILYLGIFVLAISLRFIHLGAFPLTNEESLAALRAAEGTSFASPFYIESSEAVPQPAYEILTQIVFNIFGANGRA